MFSYIGQLHQCRIYMIKKTVRAKNKDTSEVYLKNIIFYPKIDLADLKSPAKHRIFEFLENGFRF